MLFQILHNNIMCHIIIDIILIYTVLELIIVQYTTV